MSRRIRFNSRRLLLATTVLSVWLAALVAANKRFTSDNSIAEWLGPVLFVTSTLLLCAMAAVIVRTLGKRSIVAALLGAAAYVAILIWLSLATWG